MLKKSFRVLITSVGRRVELVQAFKNAAENLNFDLLVYGSDLSENAPALYFCDRVIITSKISSCNYISELLDVCLREKIDMLIPTIDTDLLLLAQNKKIFEKQGTLVMISAEDKISLCRDKRKTWKLFTSCGLLSPHTTDDVSKYSGEFPCFIKPLDGSSSINAFKIYNDTDLKIRADQIGEYIIQPYIEGKEYTVDIFCDFTGNPIYITPRERIAVRAGEVLKTRINNDREIVSECIELIKHFNPCGAITVQLIREKETSKNYYIEINPRFGGGAPLSMKAGANSAEMALRLLAGQQCKFTPEAALEGSIYSRFDQSVCVGSGYTVNTSDTSKKEIKAVIFDLDDTLYSEKEYVYNGFKAIESLLNNRIPNVFDKLVKAFEQGFSAIDYVLADADQTELKDECLRAYRTNILPLTLYKGVPYLLECLKKKEVKLGMITDGRPDGQTAKIKALGLNNFVDDIIITDTLGGPQFRKPNDIAFRIMRERMKLPYANMVYVGDNAAKDFTAPSKLGMKCIMLRNENGLYKNNCMHFDERRNIHIVDSISQLTTALIGPEG